MMDRLIGQVLGDRYLIKSLLGKQRGRRTFLAENRQAKTLVVLKLILFGPDFTWQDLKLFEREAETLKSLDHPAIPNYLDSFEVETELGKGFVLVQTFIEARSLQAHMTSGRRFSEADIKEIAQSILIILQYLHSRHPAVIHRDIKPSNVLLGDRSAHSPGKVYLVDFGSVQVAKDSGTMTVVGTYGYMPSEQFRGRAGPASDLYSLGATLIYLASGQHPSDFEYGELDTVVLTLSLSRPFAGWIAQLTRMKSSSRFESTELALQTLNDLKSHSPNRAISLLPRKRQPSQNVNISQNSSALTLESKLNDFSIISTPDELEVYFDSKHISIDSQLYILDFIGNSR